MDEFRTPALVVDLDRLEANIRRMQDLCESGGLELWPHCKTHKMVEVARRQLEAGAAGLTCAKLSEAESMLPSGVRQIFLAHSLVGLDKAPRLRAMAAQLVTLVVACTSEDHFPALEELLAGAGLRLPVMMAVDSGLGREGARDAESARRLAGSIRGSRHMDLWGIYTHEGHAYAENPKNLDTLARMIAEGLASLRESIGGDLRLWPGCTVTAGRMARLPGLHALRPGAYVFGDLTHAVSTRVMEWDQLALRVRAQVVDIPADDLALIDAGSKVFSGDKTVTGLIALPADGREMQVTRCSEEHGFVTGNGVADLTVGQIIDWIPAHVCPVVNLANAVWIERNGKITDRWTVDARGCVT